MCVVAPLDRAVGNAEQLPENRTLALILAQPLTQFVRGRDGR
jgi:hypothetical protein